MKIRLLPTLSPEQIGAFLLFAIAIVSYLAKYLLNTFLARHLSHGLFGDYAVGVRVLTIVASLMLFGTNVSAKRFLSKYLGAHLNKRIKNYVGWNFKVITTSCSIFFVLITTILLTLHFFNIKYLQTYHLLVYMLWLTPVASLALLLSSFLLSNKNIFLSSFLIGGARFIFLLVLFLVSVFFLKLSLNSITIVSVFLLATLALIVIELFFIYIKMPKSVMSGMQEFWRVPHVSISAQWARVAGKLTANSIIFMLVCYLDLLIVEIIVPGEITVDLYAATLTITAFIWIVPRSIYQFIKPKTSSLISTQKDRLTLQKILNKIGLISLLLSLTITILIILFANSLLSHFGQHYTVARIPLIILSIGYCIGTLSVSPASLLAFSHHEQTLLIVSIFELIGTIILVSVLTYYFHVLGAVIGVTIIIFCKTILLILLARKKLSIRPCLLV